MKNVKTFLVAAAALVVLGTAPAVAQTASAKMPAAHVVRFTAATTEPITFEADTERSTVAVAEFAMDKGTTTTDAPATPQTAASLVSDGERLDNGNVEAVAEALEADYPSRDR